MSGMATAGTLANTRALFGLSHVFSQASILYGPRCCGSSSSALPGGTRSVQAAPATATKTVRRVVTSSVVDIVRLRCLDTLRTAALSRDVLKPTDASPHVTKMFDRGPPVDYVEGNALWPARSAARMAASLRDCPMTVLGHRCSACAVASSAGKKHSRASSERVTSIGVPNTVVVLR